MVNDNKQKKQIELNNKIVTDFVELFRNLNNREPMETEIMDNLKDKVDITTIKKILEDGKILNLQVNQNIDNDSIVQKAKIFKLKPLDNHLVRQLLK